MVGLTIKNSYKTQEQMVDEILKNKAIAIFNLVVDIRHWNAQFNGVYAITDLVKPNPYLKPGYIKSDKNETMIWINPAFMTRQISDIASRRDGFTLKITSNKLINKHNAPNAYEKNLLNQFENNPDIPYYWERKDDEFKFMGALVVEKECMKCHEKQGYQVGDIRGGISVSFDTTKELKQLKQISGDKEQGILFLFFAAMGTLIAFFLYQNIRRSDEKKIFELNNRLKFKIKELDKFNKTLHNKVKQEVKKQRENENLLIQQSRLAALGEMIGNIAHQWRQPISAVSAVMMNIKWTAISHGVKKDFLNDRIEEANEQLNFMSQTIDDFTNFFKPNKEKEYFDVDKEVNRAYTLLEAVLQHNNIDIEINTEGKVTAFGYPNEFSQVIFNIISNAKDVLIQREIKQAKILIDISKEHETIYCKINDNAGGIEEQYLNKIFEPYFTTKDFNSTGIGLYISKEIIHKHMNGTLTAQNTSIGAQFTIAISHKKET